MTPVIRVIRTVLQVVVAMAVAVPTAIGPLGFDATTAGKIGAWCGAAVIVTNAVWNVLEHVTGTALGAVASAPPPTPPAAVPFDIPALRQGA